MTRWLHILALLTLSFGFSTATAHEVEQHFLRLTLEEGRLIAQMEIDAGYALPEFRSNENDELPTNAWLRDLPETEKQRIITEGEIYLRDTMRFSLNEEDLDIDLKFVKWGTVWPEFFEPLPHTFARMVWQVEARYLEGRGELALYWNESSEGPSLATQVISEDRKLPLTTISQGEEYSLAMIGQTEEAVPVILNEGSSIWRWLCSGFEHVIPQGLDHILFILGIFLLSPNWRSLLTQSLLFTIAHSITLGLTVAKIFPVDPQIIEPLIAASIAYIAIENLFLKQVKPWRLALIFSLGLLHGMGFGSAMSKLPVEASSLIIPLLGFNIGVEFAQIMILIIAFLVTLKLRRKIVIYQRFRIISSLAIAMTGIVWTVQRLGWA